MGPTAGPDSQARRHLWDLIRKVRQYLIIDGIRLILNEGKHLVEILPQLGLVGVWLIVIYAIAFKVFRWE